ncbi:MAG: Ku protein [Planctomycetota bacterium]
MAPRSSWKGFLKLSLVSVPVKAYTANATGADIRLNQLHEECNSRIQYKKRCPIHGEVANDEIVSGYEYAKGNYVVVDPGELDKLRTENDKSVNIDGFIAPDEIDPAYFSGRTYYLIPDGPVGQKPYSLMRQVMYDENLYAISRTVIAGKEQLVLVRPVGKCLAMSVISYDSKVKNVTAFEDEIEDQDLPAAELKLTKTLVDATLVENFDLGKYEDQYTQKLTQLIEAKVAGQEIVAAPDPEEPKIVNLMDALKQSVANAQVESKSGKTAKKATKKKASKKKISKKLSPSEKPKKTTRAKKSG